MRTLNQSCDRTSSSTRTRPSAIANPMWGPGEPTALEDEVGEEQRIDSTVSQAASPPRIRPRLPADELIRCPTDYGFGGSASLRRLRPLTADYVGKTTLRSHPGKVEGHPAWGGLPNTGPRVKTLARDKPV